jgi:hypothetical protein
MLYLKNKELIILKAFGDKSMLEKIRKTVEQICERLNAVKGRGEEATKQALVYPLLEALGYNIWLPTEVCPEYEADFAIKKNGQKEKVDIAILKDNVPQIFVEVKSIDVNLDGHEGQLARYFHSCNSVTLGILTNGIEWRFYTDTITENVMDSKPFHVAKLDAMDNGIEVLPRFSKIQFSPASINEYATELLYTAKIAEFLRNEIDLKDQTPSEYFIRWVLKSPNMFDGIVNANTVERFRGITKSALSRVIKGIVRRSISAMDDEVSKPEDNQQNKPSNTEIVTTPNTGEQEIKENNPNIITTENELKFFDNVRKIFEEAGYNGKTIYEPGKRQNVPIELSYKDTTSYFGVYLNKPAWWFVRGYIENKTPWLGFNLPTEVAEPLVSDKSIILPYNTFPGIRIAINSVDDVFKYKNLVIASIEATIKQRNTEN